MENCLASVPFKSNGKSVQFFNDRMEFNGNSIRYDDVAELYAGNTGTTVHTYIGIPVGRSFDGAVQIKTNSGKTYKIILNSMAIFGIPIIGNPRKNEKLYPPLFDAVYNIVAKNIAQKHIDKIKGGATVEVAGLNINSLEAVPAKKGKDSKKTVAINRDNYRDCALARNGGAVVYDRQGEEIWFSSFWSNKNVLLVPHILDAIFG